MPTTSAQTTQQVLASALLALPLAPADVLGVFANIHPSQVSRLFAGWETAGWIQSCRPSCLGRSRHLLYAFTATGLRTWIPRLFPEEDLLAYTTNRHLDPVGLVAHHLPRLLRAQTVYAVLARIYAQARQDHVEADLTWWLGFDTQLRLTFTMKPAPRRQVQHHLIQVPCDSYLAIGITEHDVHHWQAVQIWLDDGLMQIPQMQARVQTMQRYCNAAPIGATPWTLIIVRDLARSAMWDEAVQLVLHPTRSTHAFPGAIVLLPVTWHWPLTCGGAPSPARPWVATQLPIRSHSVFGIPTEPIGAETWRTAPVEDAWLPWPTPRRGRPQPPETPKQRITAWRASCLCDLSSPGTIAAVRTALDYRPAQKYRDMAAVADACLDLKGQLLALLLCVAWMPMITIDDLAHLFHVSQSTTRDLLSLLHVRSWVQVMTPAAHLTLPPTPGVSSPRSQGVRATENGIRLVQSLYPRPLAVYRRATRLPRAHDSGVARFCILFEQWLRDLPGVGTLWWWAGLGNRLRVYVAETRQRQTVYPDAQGVCVVEERASFRTPPTLHLQTFFVEWDMGWEGRHVWQQKLAKYTLWLRGRMDAHGAFHNDRHQGWYFVLFVVAPTERQAAMIGAVIQEAVAGMDQRAATRCRFYVTTFVALSTRLFDAAWTTIGRHTDQEPFLLSQHRLSAATTGGPNWSQDLLARWGADDLDARYERHQRDVAEQLRTLQERWHGQ